MIIQIIFDILIAVLVFFIVKKLSIGVLLIFFAKIIIPFYVRFYLGRTFDFAMYDIVSLALLCSLLFRLHEREKLPVNILIVLWFPLISGVFLALFSSALVPYEYQFVSLAKNLFLGEIVFLVAFYYKAKYFNCSFFCKLFLLVAIMSGLYGIFAYLIGMNPYITMLAYTYTGKDYMFSYFLDETRGFLMGRASGVFPHPLIWGQFWNIAIPFFVLVKKDLNKVLLWLCISVGFVNVVLCGSRTALLTLLVSASFYFLSLGYKKIIMFFLLFVVLIFLFVLYPTKSDFFANDYLTYLKSVVFFWDDSYVLSLGINGSNAEMRQSQMKAVMNFIASNPIAGIGYNYQYYCLENTGVSRYALMGMESVVFKKLVEQGFAGLICFGIVLCALFRETSKKIQIKSDYLCYLGFFLAFVASACFTGIQGGNWPLFVSLNFLLCFYYSKQENA